MQTQEGRAEIGARTRKYDNKLGTKFSYLQEGKLDAVIYKIHRAQCKMQIKLWYV